MYRAAAIGTQTGDRCCIGHGRRTRWQHRPAELGFDQLGKTDLTAGTQLLSHLLIQNGGIEAGCVAVHQPIGGRGIAHALHHHLQEHAFELLGRFLDTRLRILLELGA